MSTAGRRVAQRLAALLAAALLTGCRTPAADHDTPSGPPTMAELRAATYVGLDVADTITLRDGRWEGPPNAPGSAARPSASLAPGFVLTGNLDGDSVPEAVAALATTAGGSRSLVWAVVMTRHDAAVQTVTTIPLGDRVQIRGGTISERQLTLDLIEPGRGDPACCPGDLVSRTWAIENGNPQVVAETGPERWSLEALGNETWMLRYWSLDVPLPDSALVTVAFDDTRIFGTSGCNSYSASAGGGNLPGELVLGAFTLTRMACPEPMLSLEARVLDLLGRVTRVSFLAGQLVLSYAEPSGFADGVLLFERASAAPGSR